MKIPGAIWIICLLAAGCISQADHTPEKRVNSELIVKLENSEVYLQEIIEDDDLFGKRKLRRQSVSHIEQLIIGLNDTLDRNAADQLLKLVQAGEPYDTASIHLEGFKELLSKAAQQLRNLNHDLEYNLLPIDSVESLVYKEQVLAKELLSRAEKLKSDCEIEKMNTAIWMARADTLEQKLTQK